MALISSKTIITSISLFHLTIAYFFLTNPKTIDDQGLVFVLGESMGLPEVRGFDAQSPALALLAVVLAFFGLSDLVSLSMPEELSAIYYWGTQGDGLKNRVFFTFMFVEMVGWFWAWITLREERSGLLDKMRKQHEHEHHH
ncbi:hypothetical protein PT974_07805 [Cladobotryum mycophilum]|uniref:Increased loss of mitochondrial DNA protein 1 n=1 Tax=Cladobotryum mycophilum TaxID=491253 RepID=A0ABR0SIU7_9HYPO